MKQLKLILIFAVFCLVSKTAADAAEDEIAAGEVPQKPDERGDCPCELETYGPEVETGFIKSYPTTKVGGCTGKCTVIILPHPNKTVTLFAPRMEMSRNVRLEVFALLMDGDSKLLIPQARIQADYYYRYDNDDFVFPTFKSSINAGFELHFISEFSYNGYLTSYKIAFDRTDDSGPTCGNAIVEIGDEETVVQPEMWYNYPTGCVYKLKAKTNGELEDEDEFLITFAESKENLLAMRASENTGYMKKWRDGTSARRFKASAHDAQVISHKTSTNVGQWKMAKVTAKLIRNVCRCGNNSFTLDVKKNYSSVSITSPGWPTVSCPITSCTYYITPIDYTSRSVICLIGVKVTTQLSEHDVLTIKDGVYTHFDSDNYPIGQFSIEDELVVQSQALIIKWHTSYTRQQKNFQMNITQVLIPVECSCVTNTEKTLPSPYTFDFTFPSKCNYIYCYFYFQPTSNDYSIPLFAIDFKLTGALDSDRIIISDEKHFEEYKGSMLQTARRFESHEPFKFRFFREHHVTNETTRLSIVYDEEEYGGSSCDGETWEYNVTANHEFVVTSPGYPRFYSYDQKCTFIVHVPENHLLVLSIDEITVENFHDHVIIYQGNGSLVRTYTGHQMHQVINITEPPAVIVFQTDESTSDRGFHITASAHPILSESSSYTLTMSLVALLLLLAAAVLAAIYFYLQRREKQLAARRNEESGRMENVNEGIELISGIDNTQVINPEPIF